MEVLLNYPLFSAFFAILFSQIIKVPIAYFLKKQSTWALATSTGGMPSSHSAGVSALITSLAIQYGVDSPLVAIAATFGVIVMFDSMGVRRQSGEHGILLNQLVAEFDFLRLKVRNMNDETVNTEREQKERHLKEYLGHKPVEVFFGILTGIALAFLIKFLFPEAALQV